MPNTNAETFIQTRHTTEEAILGTLFKKFSMSHAHFYSHKSTSNEHLTSTQQGLSKKYINTLYLYAK